MIVRTLSVVAAAAAAIALAACTPEAPQTAGYSYPDYWGSPAHAAGPDNTPLAGSRAAVGGAQGSTALFGTHTAASPGVWLFPPNPYQ